MDRLSECPYCGGDVSWKGRVQDATRNDHHNNIYECGECGREIVSG